MQNIFQARSIDVYLPSTLHVQSVLVVRSQKSGLSAMSSLPSMHRDGWKSDNIGNAVEGCGIGIEAVSHCRLCVTGHHT